MKHSVLITVPRLDQPGGVANFYRVLRPCLGPEKYYFETGARGDEIPIFGTLKRLIMDYWKFHMEIKRGKYQVVHLNPSLARYSLIRDAIFLLIARAHQLPVLIFFRGWSDSLRERVDRWLPGIFPLLLNRSDEIIVLAEDFRRALAEMGVETPVRTMTTVVDDSAFEGPISFDQFRTEVNILFLSRLVKGKGLAEAIQSFAMLKRKLPDRQISLVIAGDGPERASGQAIIDREGIADVKFIGHIDGEQKRAALLDSDIFLFPTFFSEGMPNAVLEAMAYGLPVVTRPVGGLKDFFQNGRMGLISPSDDPGVFAGMLAELILDAERRKQIGEYNRGYARDHFAASKVAQELEMAYARVAGSQQAN